MQSYTKKEINHCEQIKSIILSNNQSHPIFKSTKYPQTKARIKKTKFIINNSDSQNRSIHLTEYNFPMLIKRAVCFLSKGFFSLALKDAQSALKLDNKSAKANYIISLSYLEMKDVTNAKKYCDTNNVRLVKMIENIENEINSKLLMYPNYNLYLNLVNRLYKYNAFFPKLEIQFNSNDSRSVISKKLINKN